MPELPDVEVFKRDLDAKALRQSVAKVHVGSRAGRLLHGITPSMLDQKLRGRALASTRRHGKYLFARADDAGWLVLHFGMSGRLAYAKSAERLPEDAEFLLQFENGAGLAYLAPRKLGRIDWADDPDDYAAARGLGPDALAIDYAGFRERARGRRGGVKAWLMDQGVLAGVGNAYSDEILFQAGIHPTHPVAKLDEGALKKLHQTMRRVLQQAIDADADRQAMPDGFLLPQRRAGGRCPGSGEPVKTIKVGGRTAYYCPQCQPL